MVYLINVMSKHTCAVLMTDNVKKMLYFVSIVIYLTKQKFCCSLTYLQTHTNKQKMNKQCSYFDVKIHH